MGQLFDLLNPNLPPEPPAPLEPEPPLQIVPGEEPEPERAPGLLLNVIEGGMDAAQERNAIDANTVKPSPEVREDNDLSNRSGLPVDAVEADRDAVKQHINVNEIDEKTKDAPRTRRMLTNPQIGPAVADDTDTLVGLEFGFNRLRDLAGGFIGETFGWSLQGLGELYNITGRNLEGTVLSGLRAVGLERVADALAGIPDVPWWIDPGEVLRQPGMMLKEKGEALKSGEQTVAADIAGALGQLTGQAVLYILTGGTVSTLSMLGQGVSIGVERGNKEKLKGAVVDTLGEQVSKDLHAVSSGAITALTERVGLEKLLFRLPPKIKNQVLRFLTDVGIAGGIEAAQEVAEGIMHDLATIAILNPQAEIFKGLDREAIAAGGAAGIFRTVMGAVLKGRQIHSEHQMAKKAEVYKERLNEILETAGQSSVKEQSPELFQEVVTLLTEETESETVRINAAGVETFFQAAGTPEQAVEFFEEAGIETADVQRAMRLGTDLEVSTGHFMEAVQGMEFQEGILMNVRADAGSLTMAEVEVRLPELEAKQKQIVEETRADLEGSSENAIALDDAEAIRRDFTDQARKAGQTRPELHGLMVEQMFLTAYRDSAEDVAQGREGAKPLSLGEFYRSMNLKISRESYSGQRLVEQASPEERAKINMRIRQMAFENDVRMGNIDPNDPLIDWDEVQAMRADMGLPPLEPSDLLQSAVPIQSRPMRLVGTGPHGRILNWDMGEALTARHLEKYGRTLDPENNEDDYRILVNDLSREYRNQLREQDTGTGWYVEDIKRAIETTTFIIPELADPQNRELFLILSALLSPQQAPLQNWENAILAMQGYLADGKLPLKKPNGMNWGVPGQTTGLQLMQHLIDQQGLESAIEWVRRAHTGLEIAEVRRASGLFSPKEDKVANYKANETNLTESYTGGYMFGPKVGDFMQNASGFDQDAVTVDLWLARTYNRLIGRLTDVSPEQARKREIKSDVRGIGERRMIKKIIREVAGNNNVDPSAMQAALWYFEQRLYKSHGINTTSENFSGAAEIAAQKREIPVPRAGQDDQQARGPAPGTTQDLLQQGPPELTPEFPVDATGDVVVGDTIRFTEGVFGGSFRNPKYLGTRTVEAEVTKDSYGEAKQQHTFTLRILASEGYDALEAGKTTRRKGRNVYRNGTARKQWDDENARQKALDEKHARGDIARAERGVRRGDLYQQGPTGLTPDQITAAISAADNIIELGPRISDRENTQKLEDLMEDIRRILSDAGPQAPFVARAFVELTRIGESITAETGWETIIGKTQDLKDLLLSGRAFPANDLFQRGAPELTPEAREWFGNSEVVDDSGQPKIVYHATYGDFEDFRTPEDSAEIGVHFGSDETANQRLLLKRLEEFERTGDLTLEDDARAEAIQQTEEKLGAPNIMPVYLSIQNPLRMVESRQGGWRANDIVIQIRNGLEERFDAPPPPFELTEKEKDGLFEDELYIEGETENYFDIYDEAEQAAWVVRWIKSKGYDGIVYENTFEGGGDSYIAFDPGQIKSVHATGFQDPSNILFQRDDISPLGFYSKAARLARESPQKKRDARQWLSYFKDNLKKEEFEWIIGLEEFLNSVTKDKKSVERETVAEFIDKGGISIREVVTDEGVDPGDYVSNLSLVGERTETGDDQPVHKSLLRENNKGDNFQITQDASGIPISIEIGESRWMVVRHIPAENSVTGEAVEELDSVWNTPEQARDEAFERNEEDFDLSTGGQDPAFDAQRRNTLPLQGVTTHGDARELIEAFLEKKYSVLPQTVAPPKPRFTQYSMPGTWSRAREFYITLPDTGAPNASATVRDWDVPSAHETGIREADKRLVVRIRANERVDMDGKRTLFIEEVQADRQQAGHTFGWEEPRDNEVADRIRIEATEEHARLEEELGRLDLAPLAEIPDPGASGTVGQAQRIPERERTPDIQRLLEINQRMVQLGHEIDTPLRSRLAYLNDESDTLSRELEDEGLTGAARTAQDIYYGNEETGVIKVVDYEARDSRGNFPETYFWGPVPSADMDDHLSVMRQGEAMGGQDLAAFMEENPLVEHETPPKEYWKILTDFVKEGEIYIKALEDMRESSDEGTRAIYTERLAMLEKFRALPQWKDAFDFTKDSDDRKALVYPAHAYNALDKRHEKAWGLLDEIEEVEEALEDPDGVPRMPFALPKAWVPLAFKRMIYKAAEEGFEQIAWTSGETQAERWRQLEDIDEVNYEKIEKDGRPAWNIVVRKDGEVVDIHVDSDTVLDRLEGIDKSHLIGTFGKEMAGRIMEEEGEAIRFRSWEAVQSDDNTHVDLNIYPEENFGGNKQQITVNKVQLAKWIGSAGARKVFQKLEDTAPGTRPYLHAYLRDRREFQRDIVDSESKVARKMARGHDRDMKTIKGLDMKVGGTKLRIQYDEIMPKQATNIGKAFNAETAPVDLPGGGALERLEDIRVIGLKPDEWVVSDFAPVKSILDKGKELDVRDGVSEAEKLMEGTEPGGLRRVSLKEARDHVNAGVSVIASRTYAVPEPPRRPQAEEGGWPQIDLDPILPRSEQGEVATEETRRDNVRWFLEDTGTHKNVTSEVAPGFAALSLLSQSQAEEALEHTAPDSAITIAEFNTDDDILFTGTENQVALFMDRREGDPLFADPTGAGRAMDFIDLGSDHPSGHEWAAGFAARDNWGLVREKASTLSETDNLIRRYNENLERLAEIDVTETPEEVVERDTIYDDLADLRGPIEARVKILERALNREDVLPDNYRLKLSDTPPEEGDPRGLYLALYGGGEGAPGLALPRGLSPDLAGPYDTASIISELLDEAAESVRLHNEGLVGPTLQRRIRAISAEFPNDTQIGDIGFGTGPVQTDHFDNAVRNALETGNTERVASMANNLSDRLHHLGVLPAHFELRTIDAAPEQGFRFALRYMPPAELPFREHVGEERKAYSDRENGQIVDGTDPVTTLEAIQGVIRYTRDELYWAVNQEMERRRAAPEAPPPLPEYVVEETDDGKYAVVPREKRLRPEYADLAEWPGSGESIAPVGDRERAETYAAFMNDKPLKQNLNLVEGDEELDDRARLDRYAEDGPISELAEDFFVVTGETLETFGSRDEAALRKRDLVAQQTAIEAWALPITDEIAAFSLEEGWPMWQEPGDPLGAFSGRDPTAVSIKMFEGADLSTLLHETGHLFVHVLERLATREGAAQRTRDNFQSMLDWVGATSAADLNVELNGEPARLKQEKLAEAFEVYLKEGKAPSPALKQAFAQFRQWLLRIYEQVTGRQLDVEIDDEVRRIFDRMLATEAQIAEMMEFNKMDVNASPSIRELMSPEERAIHDAAVARSAELAANTARQEAEKLALMAEQDKWINERGKVRRELEEEVWSRPPYRALWFLTQGEYRDMETPASMVNRRLDKKALEEMGLTKEEIQALPRVKNRVIYTTDKDVATDPEIIAAFLGFESGREMVDVLASMPPVNEVVIQEAEVIMRERHGDPLNDGRQEQLAEEALYSEESRAAIQAELDALARKTGQAKVGRQLVKDIVDEVFATRPVGELLTPMRYEAASRRAAIEAERAAAAGDHMLAFEKKRLQLFNHELFRRGIEARGDVQKITKHLQDKKNRRMDPKKYDVDMIASIKNLLQFYEVGSMSLKKFNMEQKVVLAASVMNHIKEQRAAGAAVILPGDLVELVGEDSDGNPQFAFKTTHWRQMTLLELRGLDDMIKNLTHIGRLRSEAEKAKLKTRAQELAKSFEENTRPRKRRKSELARPTGEVLEKESRKHAFYYEHRKLESLLRQLDGFEDLGPMWQAIFSKIAEGRNQRNRMVEKIMKDMDEVFGVYSFNERRKFKSDKSGVPIQSLGGKVLTREQRLMIALNWGNESSREAVLLDSDFVEEFGDAWNEATVQEILETLETKDLDVLEKTWEVVNQFWSEIAALERRQTGVVPQKVEAAPFTVNDRELSGGYFPLQYDGRLSSRVAIEKQDDILKSNQSGGFTHAGTRHGFTNERVGSGGRPITLQINVLMNHLEDVTQDLAFREAVMEADALMRQGALRDAIVNTMGMPAYDKMREILVKVATGGHGENLGPLLEIFKMMRLNTSAAIMGANIRVILTQPLGVFQSVERIGTGRMMQGLAEFWLHPVRSIREIHEQSMFMRERGKMLTRELDDISHKIEMPNISEKVKEWGFKPIVWIDVITVAYPTWLGAKAKAMAGKVKHVEAGDEAAAIEYADSVVRLTQGTGAPENLSMMQQRNELYKDATMFGSYFNTTMNIQSEAIEKAAVQTGRGQPVKAAGNLIYTTALLSIIPAVLAGLVLERTPDEDEEDEHGEIGAWVRWYFLMLANHMGAQVFLLRDLVNAAVTQFEYSFSPVESWVTSIIRAGKEIPKIPEYWEEGEFPARFVKNMARAFGYRYGVPGINQVIRTFDTWHKMEEDEMRHPPKNRIDAVKKLLLTGDR